MKEPNAVKIAGKCDGTVETCAFKAQKVGSTSSGQGVAGLTKAIKAVSSGAEPAEIPPFLGECRTTKVHEDGDLTAICNGFRYVITKDGKAFREVSLHETLSAPMKPLTKEILAKLPPLYSQENVKDPIVQVKFFHPMSSWTWYAIEYDPKEQLFFGWSPEDNEMGYASYEELSQVKVRGLGIERDLYFTPKPLSQVKRDEHIESDDEPASGQGKLFDRKPKLVERKDGKVIKHYRSAKAMHQGSVRVVTQPSGALIYLGCPLNETWHPDSSVCSRQVVIKTIAPVVHASEEVAPEIVEAINHPIEVKA